MTPNYDWNNMLSGVQAAIAAPRQAECMEATEKRAFLSQQSANHAANIAALDQLRAVDNPFAQARADALERRIEIDQERLEKHYRRLARRGWRL